MRNLILAATALLALGGNVRAETPVFGAAGVPKALGQSRDYDRIFGELKSAGIELFYPTFQYQEAPTAESLGFEVDFIPPCSPAAPAPSALRRHGIKLLVPSGLLYAPEGALPALAADPLRQLIECVGRSNIFGVVSYDEPALHRLPVEASRRLYERVKQIDATIPVLMVHAPLVTEPEKQPTAASRRAYLQEVLLHSRHADIVGFDLYPIPPAIAKIATPASNGRIVDAAAAVRDYLAWLKRELPGKSHLAVLQGFSYRDQFEPNHLKEVAGPEILAIVRPPNAQEALDMARLSAEGGVSVVVWYGPSFLRDEAAPLWQDIKAATSAIRQRR